MNKEILKEKLNGAGLKATPQRMIILEMLMGTTEHPSAKMVMASLKKSGYSFPLATVYNTLDILSEKGLILKLKDEKDVMRFDANTAFHIHLYKYKDDSISDYFDNDLEEIIAKRLKGLTKGKIKKMQLLIEI